MGLDTKVGRKRQKKADFSAFTDESEAAGFAAKGVVGDVWKVVADFSVDG
jgi:hypothetical protein